MNNYLNLKIKIIIIIINLVLLQKVIVKYKTSSNNRIKILENIN